MAASAPRAPRNYPDPRLMRQMSPRARDRLRYVGMDCPRALIIGGSVGGLFAAHLLRAAGWDVAVFERSRGDLADRGASIGTQRDLFDIMRRIGVPLDPSVGVAAQLRICLDRRGAIVCEIEKPSIT